MQDKEIQKLLFREKKRQKKVINLIASENYVSQDVLKALGSETTNKYAEGYPGKRYYAGNEIVDQIENLAIERALKLFKLNPKKWGVNVQALSGSPANLAVYQALLKKGEKIMGMELSHGGHLTHGHKVSFSGKFWKQVPYTVDKKTEKLDYDALMRLAKKEKPALIVAGYTAYSRKINWKKFREIADAVDAYLLVDMSHIAGLVAGGVHPAPFKYADVVTTTTHKTLRGPRGALIFARKDVQVVNERTNKAESLFELIQKSVFPGMQGGPHMNAIAGIAVALYEAGKADFKNYAKQIVKNTQALAKALKKRGWRIISDGTDNHVFLVDVWKDGKGITGREAQERLEKEGIILNMNTIPFDTRSPFNPSGIRIGCAAETTRGKKEKDMEKIAERIDFILKK